GAVGDLAETIALLLPAAAATTDDPLHSWIEDRLLPLAGADEGEQGEAVLRAWRTLDGTERFVWNKLITGAFRVGVSRNLVIRALAGASGIDEPTIAHRLSGNWAPTAASFASLVSANTDDADLSRPYPFFLAYALEDELAALGDVDDWQAEWKWDGIRAQLVRRRGRTFLWTRGEELVTERFPEIAEAARLLPDGTVLDGEILPWRDEAPLPFAQQQRRIARTKRGPKILSHVPVVLVTYDLLEHAGADVRSKPFWWRRDTLVALLSEVRGTDRFRVSPVVTAATWEELQREQARAREECARGLMLQRRDAPYVLGRRRGSWRNWKAEPFADEAV